MLQPSRSQLILPKAMQKPISRWNSLLLLSFILLAISWYLALIFVGADTEQGNVYRIIFVHVPVAWCGFLWVFVGSFFGLLTLLRPSRAIAFDRSSHAALELGTIFSLLTLITGSIWGRPTWGVWWDWDPRLTTSLVMFLTCCGYLVLRHFTPDEKARRNFSGVVSILCALNVPIVYYSVNLWRSLHQPQTFIEKTQNASADIQTVLLINFLAMTLLSLSIYKVRRQSIAAKEILETARGSV